MARSRWVIRPTSASNTVTRFHSRRASSFSTSGGGGILIAGFASWVFGGRRPGLPGMRLLTEAFGLRPRICFLCFQRQRPACQLGHHAQGDGGVVKALDRLDRKKLVEEDAEI